jgi:hypothetical protein
MGIVGVFGFIGSIIYLIGLIVFVTSGDSAKYVWFHFKWFFVVLTCASIAPVVYMLESPNIITSTVTEINRDMVNQLDFDGGDVNMVDVNLHEPNIKYLLETKKGKEVLFFLVDISDEVKLHIASDSAIIDSINKLDGNVDTTYDNGIVKDRWENKKSGESVGLVSLQIWKYSLLMAFLFNHRILYIFLIIHLRKRKYYNRDLGNYKDVDYNRFFEFVDGEIKDYSTCNFKRDLMINKTTQEHKLDKLGISYD